MVNRVSIEATAEFRAKLAELLVAVDERLAVDAEFHCPGVDCDQLGLSRHVNHEFGRLLAAVYEFGLFERLTDEARWFVSMLTRHGFGPSYFGRMLEAWSVAIVSNIRLACARELAAPLDNLRGRVGLLHEGRQPEPALSAEAKGLLDLLRARRRREAAEGALALARSGRTLECVVEDVVLPAMRHLGVLWETGRVSVAEEHAATEICRYVLYRLFDSIESAKPVGLKALASCAPGDEHELGVEIVGEYLQLKGWEVFVVGRSAPPDDILKALAEFHPHIAFFSATLVANLPAARVLVAEAQKLLPGLGIVLGGAAAVAAADVLTGPGVAVAARFADAESLGVKLASRNA
jgi:MerR family transcriptional regulator, light-induced transcriptional regulator